MTKLRVAEFSKFPGGRLKKYGPHSGEEFRRERLMPAINGLKEGEKLVVDLSDVYSFTPAFLDEAFCELIRRKIVSYEEFNKKVDFKSDAENRVFVSMIRDFLEEARDSVLADAAADAA
ncbi:MAG: STAS-like domain-containing protein [Proteobacteria bacterium]|nr:STAS-like domain-containing protein [Pseudomonadota bacterium]